MLNLLQHKALQLFWTLSVNAKIWNFYKKHIQDSYIVLNFNLKIQVYSKFFFFENIDMCDKTTWYLDCPGYQRGFWKETFFRFEDVQTYALISNNLYD